MNLDITSFFEVLIGNMKDEKLSFEFYAISLAFILLFFVIRDFALAKKEDLKDNKKEKVASFLVDVIAAWAICACCLYMIENMLVSIVFGILAAIHISSKLSERTKKKKEDKKEDNTTDKTDGKVESTNTTNNTNTINVNVTNNIDSDEDNDILPNFYDPSSLKMPEGISSFNQLNIIMILEMYGYISPNQKFKMITQSLFETPDEQVDKLLKMYVLEEKELKEAKAILNLIKLNNRLISKEEALNCIVEIERKQQKGG